MNDTSSMFEKIADKWVDEALSTKRGDLPEIVYHYTDSSGLVGMLRTDRIWATDYRFLNDRSEIEHTRKLLRGLIAERLKGAIDDLTSDLYSMILEYQEEEYGDHVLIFSMSEDKDDLSQWRGYAREGHGFTVGFCAQSLYDASRAEDSEFGFAKVEYDHNKQSSILGRALAEFEAQLRTEASSAKASAADLADRAAMWYSWFADNRAVSNKHSSFMVEREWRLRSLIAESDPNRELRARSSGSRLVQYVEMIPQGPGAKKLPIREIGIGPGFQGTEEVHAVRALCRETGYEPAIYFAETPYRRP